MASVQLSGRFEEDHFVGKWRFDGSPQWLEFEFEKDNESCFRGHFQLRENDSVQNIPETITIHSGHGKELSGKGSNEFGDFELWGERDETTHSFQGFKKYVLLKQGSEKLLNGGYNVVSPAKSSFKIDLPSLEVSRRSLHQLSPSSNLMSPEVKRTRSVDDETALDLDDPRGIMDDSLMFEDVVVRKDVELEDGDGDVVDASAVFDNDSESGGDFDPSEDILTEFQLLSDGPAVLSVDELMADVGVPNQHSNSSIIGSPLAPFEPLSVEVSSPISPLSDFASSSSTTSTFRSKQLTPATIAAPPASSAKLPKQVVEAIKLSMPPACVTASEGSLSSTGGGQKSETPPVLPSVTVRVSGSYRDPFHESLLTTSKARARRRVRDFVVGLQSRHFYPYEATDVNLGLPSYHPLHPHVKVVHGDGGPESPMMMSVGGEAEMMMSPRAMSEGSAPGKKRPRQHSQATASTNYQAGRRSSVSSVSGKPLPDVSLSQIRFPGSTKCQGVKTASSQHGTSTTTATMKQSAKLELDGSCYEGDMVSGLRHGKGIAGYFNGCVYVGEFRKGQEHGLGELRDASGALLYRGEFEHGKICGQGTFYYPDGSVYRGEMREGSRHGQGIIWYHDGSAYEGDFSHGVRSGNGTFIALDGSQYVGEWSQDVRHGKGTLKLGEGSVLDGQFKDNHADGRCSVTFAKEEAEYEGNFKDGLKDGRGTYRFNKHLAVYEGRFARDVIGGTGTLKLCPDKVIELAGEEGGAATEWMIPVDLNCEVRLAHIRAGFGVDGL